LHYEESSEKESEEVEINVNFLELYYEGLLLESLSGYRLFCVNVYLGFSPSSNTNAGMLL
jgi:hypothetical protein